MKTTKVDLSKNYVFRIDEIRKKHTEELTKWKDKLSKNGIYGRILRGNTMNQVVIDEYFTFPNITSSPHDRIVLDFFVDIFKKITSDVNEYYENNNLIPKSEKPKKIHYYVSLSDNSLYIGNIKFLDSKGNWLKKLSLEQIITNNNFVILPSPTDSFAVSYDVNNNQNLKDTIIESMLVNGSIIKNISHKNTI